jgi:hypothetical protein
VKCTSFYCKYIEKDDFTDPIVPALAIPKAAPQPVPSVDDKTGAEATKALYDAMDWKEPDPVAESAAGDLDISDERVPIPHLQSKDLPHCPSCKVGLLRPGVVWFGEPLPQKTIHTIEDWIVSSEKIDLILVIGTSAKVWPAAEYIIRAREKGARVAVVNMDRNDTAPGGLRESDWFFEGDAGVVVPEILKSVIGEI